MQNVYIKFRDTPATTLAKSKNRRTSKFLKTILFFVPQANPDFDDLIDDVSEWQLEIDPNDQLPRREIGIDDKGRVIIIMPWHRNYGYWTDNNVTLNYFKHHFDAAEIEKDEFDKNWNEFVKINS